MDIDRTQPRPEAIPICTDIQLMEDIAPVFRRALARRAERLAREAAEAEQQEQAS